MRHVIPAYLMRYNADDSERDQHGHWVLHIGGSNLGNVNRIRYLGVTIINDLKWNTCTKANRTLDFWRRNLSSCPHEVKKMAYKGLMRPILENTGPIWDPSGKISRTNGKMCRCEQPGLYLEMELFWKVKVWISLIKTRILQRFKR